MTAVAGAIAGFGAWVLAVVYATRHPSLVATINHLHRVDTAAVGGSRWRAGLVELAGSFGPSIDTDLHVVGRGPHEHGAHLATATIAGLATPAFAATAAAVLGLRVGWWIPVWVCVLTGMIAPLTVHARLRRRAVEERENLRLQLGAYLDLLAMLLSAGEADEQALQQAALAGDGRLFGELAVVYRDAARNGAPMLTAMARLGERWGIGELVEVAAAGSLAASDGAAVRRSLMTKARAIRTAQLAAEETDARLRTNKLTFPQILLALGFLLLILYPAYSGLVAGINTNR